MLSALGGREERRSGENEERGREGGRRLRRTEEGRGPRYVCMCLCVCSGSDSQTTSHVHVLLSPPIPFPSVPSASLESEWERKEGTRGEMTGPME